ncbi:MAG TPA: 5'-3' exonuclease H3TH domain-containing protein [Thermoanaerobaculia bacterium]|nr:5'-3' exonuclease H3TH domain-containing protein [Thermoanaerobaculia bacterium]
MSSAYLIDASPYIFRAYFSLPDSIRDRDGRPAQAVHGFISFLLKLIADENPSHLAVCFDRNLSASFRNEIYPPYKAQRPQPPPELESQLPACEEAARALGGATFIDDRYEADDLIATLLARCKPDDGCRVVIVSSDKDLTQLVGEHVSFYDFGKGERFGPAEVLTKFGVKPEQIVDLLALAGDAVDNIPGVPGIGKKGAAELLLRYPNVEGLYAKLDELTLRTDLRGARTLAAKLEAGRDLAFLSKNLAKVATDAPIAKPFDFDRHLQFHGADPALVDPLFERLGFKRLKDRIGRWR